MGKSYTLAIIGLVCFLLCNSLAAELPVAECKDVCDGDTVKLYMNDEIVSVRLSGIDAPELGQDYGQESRSFLTRKIHGKRVRVAECGSDRYGRPLCIIYLGEEEVNLTMLKEGLAWSYFPYDSDERYTQAEQEARAAHRGLWSNPKAQKPQSFRKDEQSFANSSGGAGASSSPSSDTPVEYWVSRTGVIHNSRCRYYKSCAGKAATNPQGRDCKKCGGRSR